ncbi:Tetratricopeptide repeat-containing protein [Micromonospora pallida]|uniref:Tetratricopeptide repeat-containing protein n=1 Tax=Micromonospora pallida TaxID=145854 RepID=A0A1C6STQ3_9ACTN|nr:Tetratricopeptide repeat-containing protein [Micromonospora pallida]
MASPFGELTDQAHQLVAAGDLSGAQELLADALADADPRPANASPELAEAASLQARVLVTLGEPHSARGWAAFAYAATTRLYGSADQRTVAAAATLAAVLHRVGSYARAARLYQEVIIELTALDGPESLRVLAAHADLATVEYARGECTVARERLQDAWELHREVYGDGHVSGIKMLARLGAMQRDCGHFTDAHDNLALARELCRQHLAPDDPLAAQVAGLARAAANPDHACDRVDDAEPPVVPAARTPTADEAGAGGYWPPEPDDHPDAVRSGSAAGYGTAAGHGAVPRPRAPEETGDSGVPGDPYPAGADRYQPPTVPHPDERTTSNGHRHAADEAWPADEAWSTDEAGYADRTGYPHEPGYGAAAPGYADETTGTAATRPNVNHRYPSDGSSYPPDRWSAGQYDDPDADDWWPPEGEVDRPDEPAGDRGPAASTLPPTVVGFTGVADQTGPTGGHGQAGGRHPEESPGVRRVAHLPVPVGSRLPVHVPRPPDDPPRRLAPLIVAGVVVVLLGTGAVIAGVARVDDPAGQSPPPGPGTPPTPGASPSGTGKPASAAPGVPPSGVSLRDNRDTVTLSWTYPAGANGPVVVSGGQVGRDPHPYQELPPARPTTSSTDSTGASTTASPSRSSTRRRPSAGPNRSARSETEPACTKRN